MVGDVEGPRQVLVRNTWLALSMIEDNHTWKEESRVKKMAKERWRWHSRDTESMTSFVEQVRI